MIKNFFVEPINQFFLTPIHHIAACSSSFKGVGIENLYEAPCSNDP